jgi:hypothetical protein
MEGPSEKGGGKSVYIKWVCIQFNSFYSILYHPNLPSPPKKKRYKIR